MDSREIELNELYNSSISAMEFNFESLMCPCNIYQLLSVTDIGDINYIATNVKYMGNIKKKKQMIDQILRRRNFMKFHAGTNRLVYKFLDEQSFVAKFPIDENGIFDNISEWDIQPHLKPFNAKMFQRSQCGTVSFSELVKPIRRMEEFRSIGESVYDLLYKKILGKFIMDDIGVSKFMNYGVRYGFGPVFLDYPRVFRLDGGKLHCQEVLSNGAICNGEIDYTDGFDFIVCKCCGKHYRARDLAANIEKKMILYDKGVDDMKIKMYDGNGQIKYQSNTEEIETPVVSKEAFMKVKLKGWGQGEPKFEPETPIVTGPNIITNTNNFGEEDGSMNVKLNFSNSVDDEEQSEEYDIEESYSADTELDIDSINTEIENDTKYQKYTKEDIIREFDLPEKEAEAKNNEQDHSMKVIPEEQEYETVYSDSKTPNYPIPSPLIDAVKAKNQKLTIKSRNNKNILSKY